MPTTLTVSQVPTSVKANLDRAGCVLTTMMILLPRVSGILDPLLPSDLG